MQPFTAEVLLSLPRPSTAILSPSKKHALIPISTHSFEEEKTSKSIHLLDIATGKKSVVLEVELTEVGWLDSENFGFLKKSGEDTEIWGCNVESSSSYLIGTLPVEISNLKFGIVDAMNVNLMFSAVVYSDGNIFTVKEQKKEFLKAAKGSDVRVYDELFVRHWDEWKGTHGELTQFFVLKLTKNKDSATTGTSEDSFELVENDKWSFDQEVEVAAGTESIKLFSPLAGTKLECPVGPFGGSSDYDITSTHVCWIAKDVKLNPAFHTRIQVWLMPLEPKSGEDGMKMLTLGVQGACSAPTFSSDGSRVAWLEMDRDGYESDKNNIRIYEINSSILWTLTTDSTFDRSPSSLAWSPSGESLYFTADSEGLVVLFSVPAPILERRTKDISDAFINVGVPKQLTKSGSVSGFSFLSEKEILITSNSFVSTNFFSVLSSDGSEKVIAKFTGDLEKEYGLSKGEIFTFTGAAGGPVSGWCLRPPPRELAEEKLPLAFLVHGGPQGAWSDSWSTRWNPNSYATAGYLTIAINPTGSTGYGQAFCDAIQGQWGGTPFQDLVLGLQHVKENYNIDEERTCMLGASYGGFMANWMQGHSHILKFAAIVCHDGVFDTAFPTDEMYFAVREFQGEPWVNPDGYRKWSPNRPDLIKNFSTPQLIIHSGKDYRIPETEALGMFTALQRMSVPSRLVYFENENHWVLKPANSIAWHAQVFEWINTYTAKKAIKTGSVIRN